MATRKKKELTPNVSSGGWPKIQQGTHLTVKTFEDGHTELVWDDEQLLKEVREAIASVKTVKPAVKAKANKKVPETMKRKEETIKAPVKKPVKKKVAK
jgi:hypothetical protein